LAHLFAANTTRFVVLSLAATALPAKYPVPTHRFVSAAPTPTAPLSPAEDSKRKLGEVEEPVVKAAKVDPQVVAASNGA